MIDCTAIIAEYNPFHNGHAYQIKKAKELTGNAPVIILMSGSFTERGSSAILSKWSRAKAAIMNGADIVIELPFCFAVRSAEHFARGGIQLLSKLGIRGKLAFGIEGDDPDLPHSLQRAASASEDAISPILRSHLKRGASYGAARAAALASISGASSSSLRMPNNILAVEYLRALRGSRFSPLMIKRLGAGYSSESIAHSPEGGDMPSSFQSAAAIRAELLKPHPDKHSLRASMPIASIESLRKSTSFPDDDLLLRPLIARLLTIQMTEIQSIYGIREGLENRFLKQLRDAKDLTSLLTSMETRRYPISMLRREILYILLGITRNEMHTFDDEGPLYARLLACSKDGRMLLHELSKTSSIPLISKTGSYIKSRSVHVQHELSLLQRMLKYDILATDLRAALMSPPGRQGEDFLTSPYFY